MKRLFALLLTVLMLTGCAAGTGADPEPVWQTKLDGGGALSISGCTVTKTAEADFWFDPDLNGTTLPLLYIEGVPTLTLFDVTEEEMANFFLGYIEPYGEGWLHYQPRIPVEKLDYIRTQDEDGTLHFRLDTVYNYRLCLGDQQWLLIVSRDDI